MITPQLTEQYGHVLRVSLVREIFNVFACARTGLASNPNAVRAAPPAIEPWRNARREIAFEHLRVRSPTLQGRYLCRHAQGQNHVRGPGDAKQKQGRGPND